MVISDNLSRWLLVCRVLLNWTPLGRLHAQPVRSALQRTYDSTFDTPIPSMQRIDSTAGQLVLTPSLCIGQNPNSVHPIRFFFLKLRILDSTPDPGPRLLIAYAGLWGGEVKEEEMEDEDGMEKIRKEVTVRTSATQRCYFV